MIIDVNTRDFGLVQVEADAIYDFPQGIYGFEEDTKFAVFQQAIDDVSFLYLQSTVNLVPCFLIFEPWDLYPGYAPQLSTEDMQVCGVNTIDELIFLTIATVPDNIQDLSINIRSPIVLNPKTRKGFQVILQNPDYTVRYKPFQPIGKEGV